MVKVKFTGLKMAPLALEFPDEVTGLELKVAVQHHFQVENTEGMDLLMKGKVLQVSGPNSRKAYQCVSRSALHPL